MRSSTLLMFAGSVVLALLGIFLLLQSDSFRTGQNANLPTTQPTESSGDTLPDPGLDTPPALAFKANVDGLNTTITGTISNTSPFAWKDIVLSGLKLEGAGARESTALPLKFTHLAPGESQQFVLHYDQMMWVGGDVSTDRIDLKWAEKPFDYTATWVVESKDSSSSTTQYATPQSHVYADVISLDPQQARELKLKRDSRIPPPRRDPIDGEWVWQSDFTAGTSTQVTGKFERNADTFTGSVTWKLKPEVEQKITIGHISEETITFEVQDKQKDYTADYVFNGKSDGNKIIGTVQMSLRKASSAHISTQLKWTAERKQPDNANGGTIRAGLQK